MHQPVELRAYFGPSLSLISNYLENLYSVGFAYIKFFIQHRCDTVMTARKKKVIINYLS